MILVAIRFDRLAVGAGLIWLLSGFSAPGSTNATWHTRVWQTDEGLLNNNISAIVQSRDDYLWLVTPVSLMRFDGVSFSQFPIEDFTGWIKPHNIRTLFYGRTGVLWIIPNYGRIIGLNPDFSTVTLANTGLPKGAAWTLAEAGDGSLWLGYSSALYRIKEGKVKVFSAEEGVPPDGLPALASDGAGNIWLAKGNQICAFQNGQFQQISSAQGTPCLAATHTNAIWFVSGAHLLKCDTTGTLQDYGAFQDLSGAPTVALLEDHAGSVWIGTAGNGLFRYDKSGIEKIETSHSSILSLVEDREGNIWVGTGGGGLDRVSLSSVRLERFERNQTSEQIQSICEDTNGEMWGATYNGTLISRINGQWKAFLTNAPFAGTVRCVAANRRGGIWIGTQNGKLLHLVNTNYTTLNLKNGPILTLFQTSSGDLWIVGYHAQCLHDGQLLDVNQLRHKPRISAIAEDTAGNIWFAGRGAVMRFNGKDIVDESPHLPISGRNISCLYANPDGSLLIGCGGIGLLEFKDGKVDQIGAEQGLCNDYISQIVADGHGWLWFGSDLGVFKVRQLELEQAMVDHSIRLHPIVYGRNEGLSSMEAVFSTASPFVLPRAIHTRDGRVWLLMGTGIVVANPMIVPDNDTALPVLLTRVAMDGQTIASYGIVGPTRTIANLKTLNVPLRLSPGFRHLEFDYTAMHMSAPENIHFRYQMAGLDNDWIDADTKRSADYSRLAAGKYQFRVKACISDAAGSEMPATLAFTVAPFFWQTWWFCISALLLFTSLVIAIVRYISFRRLRLRLRAVEQQAAIERERGRIARDIHDDLGNRLTEIQLLADLAQRNHATSDAAITHDQEISSAARQATNALDEIVWAINPHNDTLPHLINYLGQFAAVFLRAAGIRCRLELPEHPPVKPVSAEVRHNLFLVIKELLNNVVRHAHATEVFLRILVMNESLSVIIEDNGRGFNGEIKINGADGLENMRQRITEIAGQFQIKTSPSNGTRISFSGPWLARK